MPVVATGVLGWHVREGCLVPSGSTSTAWACPPVPNLAIPKIAVYSRCLGCSRASFGAIRNSPDPFWFLGFRRTSFVHQSPTASKGGNKYDPLLSICDVGVTSASR